MGLEQLIQTAAPQALDGLFQAIVTRNAKGQIGDDEAQAALELIAARRRPSPRPQDPGPSLFARARTQSPPDRSASQLRRRRLASSGPMPPALAAHFTCGELAVLKIVADEVRHRAGCSLTYDEMAARAGVCRSIAKRAVRRAEKLALVHRLVRPRRGQKHRSNVLTVVSPEWRAWIERRPSLIGGTDLPTTDRQVQERALSGPQFGTGSGRGDAREKPQSPCQGRKRRERLTRG